MKWFPDLPPIWLLGFMLAAWALARVLPLAEFDAAALRLVGQGLALAGVALIVWSAIWFRRKRTTIEPHHVPKALIEEGPYAWSRNPIYLAMALILAGEVLWLGALLPFVLLPLFILVIDRRFAGPEEEGLRSAFGAQGEDYIARVRRWL